MLKSVLLVEDDEASQTLMKQAFREARVDCELNVADNGAAALDFLKLRETNRALPMPGLILLDLNLPGKSGADVLHEVKSRASTKDIPVVILSGSDDESDIALCGRYPGCRHALKPVRFDDLVKLVRSFEIF